MKDAENYPASLNIPFTDAFQVAGIETFRGAVYRSASRRMPKLQLRAIERC
jgi:hypothetical protein